MMHMSITAELKNVSPDTVMKWKNLKSIIFVKMRLIKVTLSKQEWETINIFKLDASWQCFEESKRQKMTRRKAQLKLILLPAAGWLRKC